MPSITMIPTFMILSLVFLLLNLITTVHAGLYVVTPSDGSTCHGGQPCTVTWLDDGELPLLTSIGACTVGLYTKDEQLLQQIEPVDVASTHSLTFTPNPEAGPNSGEYYIAFTSISLKVANSSDSYQEYSPFFRLDNMSGTFDSAIPSLTRTISVPSTVASPPLVAVTTTETVGVPSSSTSSSHATPTASSTSPAAVTSTTQKAGSSSSETPSSSTSTTPSVTPSTTTSDSVSSSTVTPSAMVTSVRPTTLTVPPSTPTSVVDNPSFVSASFNAGAVPSVSAIPSTSSAHSRISTTIYSLAVPALVLLSFA